MRCSRCGNENSSTNRFCGMCGAPLLAPAATPPAGPGAATSGTAQASGARDAGAHAPAAPRTVAPAAEVPAIAGPSFLGLNQAPAGRGAHLERSSGNLDYLLEDEEESKGSAGKIFLVLIVLALALGYGYLRWRHVTISSLLSAAQSSGSQKPSPSAAAGDEAQTSSGTAPIPTDSAPASSPKPTDSSSQPTGQPPVQPAPDSAANPPAANPAPANSGTAPDPAATAPPATAKAESSTEEPSPPPAKKAARGSRADSKADSKAEDTADPNVNDPNVEERTPPRKPRAIAKPSAAQPFDQVAEAEKYIYGRGGARQDCDRGLRMLQPAAEHANPKAMISLGALYSTGVCTPRDLPTAYRWFALALRKDPDNQPLQENLQRLWAQMTQPERQLAVKLSQ